MPAYLVDCPTCGNPTASTAPACPKCGCPHPVREARKAGSSDPSGRKTLYVRLGIGAVILWLISGLLAPSEPETRARAALVGQARTDSVTLAALDDSMATVERSRRAAYLLTADGLALTSARWERGEYGTLGIVGDVVNEGPARRYASITFAIYDRTGAVVGSALANVSHIDAGGTWRFRAFVTEDQPGNTFQPTEISGL